MNLLIEKRMGEDNPLPCLDLPGGGQIDTWDLVRLAQHGDAQAFGIIYQRYRSKIYGFVFAKVRDREIAEDVTQETFARALARIDQVAQCGADFGTWLVRIARNIVYDRSKSAPVRREIHTDQIAAISPAVAGAEEQILARVVREEVVSMVNMLSPEYRTCVLLRFFEGLSVAETAKAMRRTVGATRALQYRAVRKLAELVRDRPWVFAW